MKCPSCNQNGFAPDTTWTDAGDKVNRFHCKLCGKSVFEGAPRFKEIARAMLAERAKNQQQDRPAASKTAKRGNMEKNKLADLNNYLFDQLDRLSNKEIKGDQLKEEIERSKAVTAVSREIIANGSLVLSAQKAYEGGTIRSTPKMLGLDPETVES